MSDDVRPIRLPRWGHVAADPGVVPWLVFDEEGRAVEPVRRYLIDFVARYNRPGSVRSYAFDLLRWWRWLHVVDVPWNQATPAEGGDFALWLGATVKVPLVSPELASVLATIIKRLRDVNGGKIPLVARYDSHERVTGPLLPHLFQRRPYWQPQVMSEAAVKHRLDRTLEATGLRDQAGRPPDCTPHDFRGMFATEAVTGGLPVHIAARVLGHKTPTTARAYLAVFQDDLVRTYRGFLDRRRADRPQDEHREPTEQEWRDFQQHFELREVSLGTCGRPYGTPCKHEHACIRCPVLQMDPHRRSRLGMPVSTDHAPRLQPGSGESGYRP